MILLTNILIFIKTLNIKNSFLLQIDRIAAPTQSSSLHSRQAPLFKECPRHAATVSGNDNESQVTKQSRKWWIETANHLKELRSSLVKQQILPPLTPMTGENQLQEKKSTESTIKIDEFFAENRKEVSRSVKDKQIQVFPRLRLSRPKPRNQKIRVPVAVTILQFPRQES